MNGNGGCSFWQPVQTDSQPKSSGLVLDRRPLGAILHSSNEPGELSQWLCHDDSTINIVLVNIIIIIIIGHFGDNFTGQMTQPTVSQHRKTMVSQPCQGLIIPGSAH